MAEIPQQLIWASRMSCGERATAREPPSGGTGRNPLFPIRDATNLRRGPAGEV